MIPLLLDRGIHVQIVTGAFRPIAPVWATLAHMNVVVSIDGLQPEHDARHAPETYDRILKKIAGQKITIHCTVTGQMMKRPGYLKEFLEYWTPRAEIQKVWFSLFTPQVGDRLPEMLQPHERLQAIADMLALRKEFPKLDMPEGMIRRFATPPRSPRHCVFALTTQTLSADLKAKIVSCQFGGNPDGGSCGCIASMGLAAGAAHRLGGIIPVRSHLQSLRQDWSDWPGSVRTAGRAGSRGSTAAAALRMKTGETSEEEYVSDQPV
jgi:hypothetical protein